MREVKALFWSSSFRLGQSPIWNYLRQRTLTSVSSVVESFLSSADKKSQSHIALFKSLTLRSWYVPCSLRLTFTLESEPVLCQEAWQNQRDLWVSTQFSPLKYKQEFTDWNWFDWLLWIPLKWSKQKEMHCHSLGLEFLNIQNLGMEGLE